MSTVGDIVDVVIVVVVVGAAASGQVAFRQAAEFVQNFRFRSGTDSMNQKLTNMDFRSFVAIKSGTVLRF
jgi:hypothetical protein